MRGVNKSIIVGTLGADPEVRYMSSGKAVANLSVATSEQWKDQQGQKQESTEWHRIVIYDRLAEIAGEYLRKGSQAYFEGKLKTRKWQDQQGQDRYTTEIVANQMQMLGGGQSNGQQAPVQRQPAQQQAPSQQGGYQNQPNPTYQQQAPARQAPQQQLNEPSIDFDDSIPF